MLGGIGPVNDELMELLYNKDNSYESGHDMTKKPCRSGNISVIDSEYVPLKIKGSKFPDIKGFIKKFLKK